MILNEWGWNDFFSAAFAAFDVPDLVPVRVISVYGEQYRVICEKGELRAVPSGKFRHEHSTSGPMISVGDWVALSLSDSEKAVIRRVLPRKSKLSRKAPGKAYEEQVVAANVDIVFLVTAINREFNLRRLERYLALVWESGARPIILLNKADLCEDVEAVLQETRRVAIGVDIHAISCKTRSGIERLRPYLNKGTTAALLGSSGVGKSTLINRLAQEDIRKVNDVRHSDGKGKHTTTRRDLLRLPGGALIIDTPGMRELQLWDAEAGLSHTFSDIGRVAERCKFNDCRHLHEPNCAVKKAIDNGELDARHLASYHKLQKEADFLTRKKDKRKAYEEKQRVNKALRDKKDSRPFSHAEEGLFLAKQTSILKDCLFSVKTHQNHHVFCRKSSNFVEIRLLAFIPLTIWSAEPVNRLQKGGVP